LTLAALNDLEVKTALNDLEVKTASFKNAYLTAPVTEKICCVPGPEVGANTGK
jgi:hypothetical protein